MDTSKLRKVITLHLNGESIRSIADKAGMSPSTVEGWVEGWKRGKYSEFQDARPYIDRILEVAKYMKAHSLGIEDIMLPYLNNSVLAEMGIDLSDMLAFYSAIRKQDSETVSSLIVTVRALHERGINFHSLNQETQNLLAKTEEMKSNIASSENRLKELEGKIGRMIRDLESLAEKRQSLGKEVSALEDRERDLSSSVRMKENKIRMAERFMKFVGNTGRSEKDMDALISRLRSMGFDADNVIALRDLEDYSLSNSIPPSEAGKAVKSLMSLAGNGWGANDISALSSAAGRLNEGPKEVLKWINDYGNARDDLDTDLKRRKALLDEVDAKVRSMERDLSLKSSELSRIQNDLSSKVETVEKYRSEMASLSGECASMGEDIDLARSFISLIRSLDPDAAKAMAGIFLSHCISDIIQENPQAADLLDIVLRHKGSVRLTERQASDMRDIVVHGILRIGRDGIAGVSYPGMIRMIDARSYEELMEWKREFSALSMQVKADTAKLRADRDDFEKVIQGYGRDFRSFMEDYLSGKAQMGRIASEVIFHTAREVIREKVNQITDPESIRQMVIEKYSTASNFFFPYTDEAGNPGLH